MTDSPMEIQADSKPKRGYVCYKPKMLFWRFAFWMAFGIALVSASAAGWLYGYCKALKADKAQLSKTLDDKAVTVITPQRKKCPRT